MLVHPKKPDKGQKIKYFCDFTQYICICQKKSVTLQPQVAKVVIIMDRPVFKEYKTPEERAAVFEKWIHLREEWREHVIQREKELGIYNEVVG